MYQDILQNYREKCYCKKHLLECESCKTLAFKQLQKKRNYPKFLQDYHEKCGLNFENISYPAGVQDIEILENLNPGVLINLFTLESSGLSSIVIYLILTFLISGPFLYKKSAKMLKLLQNV